MKAIVCSKYGPPEVLQLKEVEKPTPKNNELLIKIFATTVTSSDCIVRGFKLPNWHPMGIMMRLALGFSRPRNPIIGMVLAGEVESAGKDVKKFEKGDPLFSENARLTIHHRELRRLPHTLRWSVLMLPFRLQASMYTRHKRQIVS